MLSSYPQLIPPWKDIYYKLIRGQHDAMDKVSVPENSDLITLGRYVLIAAFIFSMKV